MGFTATCDEGEIIIRYNGKVFQKHFLEDWFEIKEAELLSNGADYVETYSYRTEVYEDDCVSDSRSFTHPEDYDVSSETAKWPPTLTIDKGALASQIAKSKPSELRKAPSIDDALPVLICKDFNVEVQVDPRFIHHVWFGWQGYLNTTFARLQTDLSTAVTFLRQQQYKLLKTRCKDLKAVNFPITDIIILGNESLNRALSRRAPEVMRPKYDGLCKGPLAQLAAITEIRTLLGDVNPLPCVFQDPQTSKLEQEFLRFLGHTIVDDPDAFGLISANSLVIFIHNPGMEEWIVRGAPAWPAAMVAWTPEFALTDPMASLYRGREEIQSRIQRFKKAYKVLPFMENKIIHSEESKSRFRGGGHNKYNFHLRKDLDGAADFSFSV